MCVFMWATRSNNICTVITYISPETQTFRPAPNIRDTSNNNWWYQIFIYLNKRLRQHWNMGQTKNGKPLPACRDFHFYKQGSYTQTMYEPFIEGSCHKRFLGALKRRVGNNSKGRTERKESKSRKRTNKEANREKDIGKQDGEKPLEEFWGSQNNSYQIRGDKTGEETLHLCNTIFAIFVAVGNTLIFSRAILSEQ